MTLGKNLHVHITHSFKNFAIVHYTLLNLSKSHKYLHQQNHHKQCKYIYILNEILSKSIFELQDEFLSESQKGTARPNVPVNTEVIQTTFFWCIIF